MPISWQTIENEIRDKSIHSKNLEELWSRRTELEGLSLAGDDSFKIIRKSLHQTVCDLIKKKEAEEAEERVNQAASQRHEEIAAFNKKAIEVSEEAVRVSREANRVSEAANKISESANASSEKANTISEKANAISRRASFYSQIALYVAIAALIISGFQFILDWRGKPATVNQPENPAITTPQTKLETQSASNTPSSSSILSNTTLQVRPQPEK